MLPLGDLRRAAHALTIVCVLRAAEGVSDTSRVHRATALREACFDELARALRVSRWNRSQRTRRVSPFIVASHGQQV